MAEGVGMAEGAGDGARPRVGLSLSLGGHEEAASLRASPGLVSSTETMPRCPRPPPPPHPLPSAAFSSFLTQPK